MHLLTVVSNVAATDCHVTSTNSPRDVARQSQQRRIRPSRLRRGYSINESGFRFRYIHVVNPNPDSVKKCILLMNLNLDSVNPAWIPFHLRLWMIGPILWGHSGPLCHALSLLLLLWTSILHCHSPGVARRLRYSYSWLQLILVGLVVSTVATPGEWQCKIRTGGVRRLAVANGPNIFQMLLV